MTNKTISSVILAACFPILAITPSHQASLLFVFISGNKIVASVRLAVALLMFAVSFRLISLNRISKKTQLYAGLSLISFGLIGMLITSLNYVLYDYLKILDIMIILEAGIILCSGYLLPTPKPAIPASAKKDAKGRMSLRQA